MRIKYEVFLLLRREKVEYFKIQDGVLSSKKITSKPKERQNHFFLKSDLGLPNGIYYIKRLWGGLKLFFDLQKNPYDNDFVGEFVHKNEEGYDREQKELNSIKGKPEMKYIHSKVSSSSNLYLYFESLKEFEIFDDTDDSFKFDDVSTIDLFELKKWTKYFMKNKFGIPNDARVEESRKEVKSQIKELFDRDENILMKGKFTYEIEEELRDIRFVRYKKTNYGVDCSYESIEKTKEEVFLENELEARKKHDNKIKKIHKSFNEKIECFDGKLSVDLIGNGSSIKFQALNIGLQELAGNVEIGTTEKKFKIPLSNKLLPNDPFLKFDVDVEKRTVHYFNRLIHYVKYY